MAHFTLTLSDMVGDDTIDVQDILDRFDALTAQDGDDAQPLDADDAAELAAITSLMEEMAGYGGMVKHHGIWYPDTLISDDSFAAYAREQAEEMYSDTLPGSVWPFNCIDWEMAARDLRMDYTPSELPYPWIDSTGGVHPQTTTYWWRS